MPCLTASSLTKSLAYAQVSKPGKAGDGATAAAAVATAAVAIAAGSGAAAGAGGAPVSVDEMSHSTLVLQQRPDLRGMSRPLELPDGIELERGDVLVDDTTNSLVVCDGANYRVRYIDLSTRNVSTLCGTGDMPAIAIRDIALHTDDDKARGGRWGAATRVRDVVVMEWPGDGCIDRSEFGGPHGSALVTDSDVLYSIPLPAPPPPKAAGVATAAADCAGDATAAAAAAGAGKWTTGRAAPAPAADRKTADVKSAATARVGSSGSSGSSACMVFRRYPYNEDGDDDDGRLPFTGAMRQLTLAADDGLSVTALLTRVCVNAVNGTVYFVDSDTHRVLMLERAWDNTMPAFADGTAAVAPDAVIPADKRPWVDARYYEVAPVPADDAALRGLTALLSASGGSADLSAAVQPRIVLNAAQVERERTLDYKCLARYQWHHHAAPATRVDRDKPLRQYGRVMLTPCDGDVPAPAAAASAATVTTAAAAASASAATHASPQQRVVLQKLSVVGGYPSCVGRRAYIADAAVNRELDDNYMALHTGHTVPARRVELGSCAHVSLDNTHGVEPGSALWVIADEFCVYRIELATPMTRVTDALRVCADYSQLLPDLWRTVAAYARCGEPMVQRVFLPDAPFNALNLFGLDVTSGGVLIASTQNHAVVAIHPNLTARPLRGDDVPSAYRAELQDELERHTTHPQTLERDRMPPLPTPPPELLSRVTWLAGGHRRGGPRADMRTGHDGLDTDIVGYVDGAGHEARFRDVRGLSVSERHRCAFVIDNTNDLVRRVTLPPHFFSSP